ncbi:TPM domain-containing protein [Methylomonas sp. MgM2]
MIAKIRSWPRMTAALIIAFVWQIAACAEVPIPALERHVTDLTNTLTPQQQASLESRLATFEHEKGSQIAVLIVPTTQPETIEQYSIRVVDRWRLGRENVDDGVLMLIAKNDRITRIEVGYGLEGAIPDALAKRIIDDVMIPYFRKGDFAAGIDAGVDRLIGLIRGEPLPELKTRDTKAGSLEQYLVPLLFAALITGGLFRILLGKFFGGLVNSGFVAFTVWLLGGGLIFAVFLGFVAFLIAQGNNPRGFHRGYGGGFGGNGFSGGSGGFSGGGGGFGGGGASGRW